MIFHPESGKIEVLNEYKTLKGVIGIMNVNCQGVNYSNSFDFEFLYGSETLPKVSKDFLISDDKEFDYITRYNIDDCPQGIFYYGKYYIDEGGKYRLGEVTSFKVYMGEDKSIVDIKKEKSSNIIQNNFCLKCDIKIQLNASNIKHPIIEENNFIFTLEDTTHTFGETYDFPKLDNLLESDCILGLQSNVKVIEDAYAYFPYGINVSLCQTTPYDNYTEEYSDCKRYLCEEINKKYPNSLNCELPVYPQSTSYRDIYILPTPTNAYG